MNKFLAFVALLLAPLAALHAAEAPISDAQEQPKASPLPVVVPVMQPVDITRLPKGVKRLDLFLLMGQSNMKGRGQVPAVQKRNPRIVMMHIKNDQWYVAQEPLHFDGDPATMTGGDNAGVGSGLTFAEALVAREPDVMVGLIPCAKSGSWVNLWQKGKGDTLYDRTVQRAQLALKKAAPGQARLCGALWLQGESDSTDGRYPFYSDRVLKVVDNLRADLQQPDLPFIACTIGSFIAEKPVKQHVTKPKDQMTHWNNINDVLLKLPSLRPYTACVDARDLKDGHIGDYLHYNSEAQAVIGWRFAEKYLQLSQSEEAKK